MFVYQSISSDELEFQEYLRKSQQTLAQPGMKIKVTAGYWAGTTDTVIESGIIDTMFGPQLGVTIQPGTAGTIIINEGQYEIIPDTTEPQIMNDLIRKIKTCA